MANNLGTEKMKVRILKQFYWPGIFKDVTIFCRSCTACQKSAKKQSRSKAPLVNVPVIGVPFHKVGIDIVGNCHAVSRAIAIFSSWWTRQPATQRQ